MGELVMNPTQRSRNEKWKPCTSCSPVKKKDVEFAIEIRSVKEQMLCKGTNQPFDSSDFVPYKEPNRFYMPLATKE